MTLASSSPGTCRLRNISISMYSTSGRGPGKARLSVDRRAECLERRKHLAEKPRQLGGLGAAQPLRHVLVDRKAEPVALPRDLEALRRERDRHGAVVVLRAPTAQQLAFLQPLQLVRDRRLRQDHFVDEFAHAQL